jgi:hypothetical protein
MAAKRPNASALAQGDTGTFDSVESAATAGLRSINDRSTEFGGGVLYNPQTKKYAYTVPTGDGNGEHFSARIQVPQGYQLQGLFHSHPTGADSTAFSNDDINMANQLKMPSYILPYADNKIRRFDPGKTSINRNVMNPDRTMAYGAIVNENPQPQPQTAQAPQQTPAQPQVSDVKQSAQPTAQNTTDEVTVAGSEPSGSGKMSADAYLDSQLGSAKPSADDFLNQHLGPSEDDTTDNTAFEESGIPSTATPGDIGRGIATAVTAIPDTASAMIGAPIAGAVGYTIGGRAKEREYASKFAPPDNLTGQVLQGAGETLSKAVPVGAAAHAVVHQLAQSDTPPTTDMPDISGMDDPTWKSMTPAQREEHMNDVLHGLNTYNQAMQAVLGAKGLGTSMLKAAPGAAAEVATERPVPPRPAPSGPFTASDLTNKPDPLAEPAPAPAKPRIQPKAGESAQQAAERQGLAPAAPEAPPAAPQRRPRVPFVLTLPSSPVVWPATSTRASRPRV